MKAIAKGNVMPNMGRSFFGASQTAGTILANTIVVNRGDAVKTSTGFLTNASITTGAIAGIVEAVVDINGIFINPDSGKTDVWTMASDNQTVAKNRAIIDESPFTIYSFLIDAAPGTTTGSNLRNYYVNFTDSTQLSESSALSTGLVIRLLGADPDAPTTRVLGTINYSETRRTVGS